MTVIIMTAIALSSLLISLLKSRKQTKTGLKMAGNMLVNTFIEVSGLMAIVGLVLALLPPELIKQLLGNTSITQSAVSGALIGTITIMPAVVAFPLSKSLYQNGAHLVAIAAFLTTLTMVGFATLPIEINQFGKRFAYVRNGISFLAALAIAFAMGVFL